jgi:hypothetical protein
VIDVVVVDRLTGGRSGKESAQGSLARDVHVPPAIWTDREKSNEGGRSEGPKNTFEGAGEILENRGEGMPVGEGCEGPNLCFLATRNQLTN